MKKNFYLALLGIAIGGIGFGLVTPVTVVLLEQNKTPAVITGLVTMLGYFSIVVFSFFSGRIIDKYGLRKTLIAGLLVWMIGALGHIFWRNYLILGIVKFVMGIGGTFVFVSTEVIINKFSSEKNRGRNIGLYVVLLSTGIAAGTLLIWTIKLGDWVPFTIGSAIMLLVIIIQILFFDDVNVDTEKKASGRMPLLKMPFIALASALIYGFFEASIIVALPLFALRHNFTSDQVSYFLASFVIGGIVLLYFISFISDKYYKYRLLLIISLILAGLFVLPAVSIDFMLLMTAFFLMGGIVPSYYTIGLNYTVEKVSGLYISEANGYYIMMYGIGTIIGPLFGSILVDLSSDFGYWIFSAGLCLGFYCFFAFLRTDQK